jgi:NTE family protein
MTAVQATTTQAAAPAGQPRIGLALGGGSARGLAHVPMLEAFDELGIRPAVIAGTSMGAICGAAYAAGLSGAELRQEMLAIFGKRRHLLRHLAGKMRHGYALWSLRHPTVIDNVTLFEMLLPEALRCDFGSLRIPFLAVAVDFYAMEQVVLDSGPLIPALGASSALPSLARPVTLDGRLLIDGGYANPVPYDVIAERVDVTVAVDVTGSTQSRSPRGLDLVSGATQILFQAVVREKLKRAPPDIFIKPEVGTYGSLDYFKVRDIFRAAEPAKDLLKAKLYQRIAASG